MKVYIIGCGYVGLVTGACLAKLGHEVCGVDVDKRKIEMLKQGKAPFYEPGVEELLRAGIRKGKLFFRHGIDEVINNYDLAIIAVGTPEREKDGGPDLFYVSQTAKEIAQHVTKKEFFVVGKSTVPIGTTRRIEEFLRSNNPNTKFHVGSNPETLREGSAVQDFMKPDRIIIGGGKGVCDILERLYEKIDCPKIVTDVESAELIKLVANFMLAQRISTANMVARICDCTSANIESVMHGVGLDGRIGPSFLQPGVGFGGSCFPKDVKNILKIAEHYYLPKRLFDSVIQTNEDQIGWIIRKIEKTAGLTLRNLTIAVWGLSFKPETDDTREAPSKKIIRQLLEEKARVKVFDPIANVKNEFGEKITHCTDMYEAVKGAEILLVVTEWDCFRDADLSKVKELMETPKIVDGRNIFDSKKVRSLGFKYKSVGRP